MISGVTTLGLKSCYLSMFWGFQSEPINMLPNSILSSKCGHYWHQKNKMTMAIMPNFRL